VRLIVQAEAIKQQLWNSAPPRVFNDRGRGPASPLRREMP
jgi:hypothetical protein